MTQVTSNKVYILPDVTLSSDNNGGLVINGQPIPTPTSTFESVTLIPDVVLTSNGSGELRINGQPIPTTNEFDEVVLLPDVTLTSNGSGELLINGDPIPTPTSEFDSVTLLPDVVLTSDGAGDLLVNGVPIPSPTDQFNSITLLPDVVLTSDENEGLEINGVLKVNQSVTTTSDVQFNKIEVPSNSNIHWGSVNENTRIAGNSTTLSLNAPTTIECNANTSVTGNITVTGTVDGVDVSVLNTQVQNIQNEIDEFPDQLKSLTTAEIQQIENIDDTTISPTQWSYLGNLNQNLSTTSDVGFDNITASGDISTTSRTVSIHNEQSTALSMRKTGSPHPAYYIMRCGSLPDNTFDWYDGINNTSRMKLNPVGLDVTGRVSCSSLVGTVDPLPVRDNLGFEDNEGIQWGSSSCQITGAADTNRVNISGTVRMMGGDGNMLFENQAGVGSITITSDSDIPEIANGIAFLNSSNNPVMAVGGLGTSVYMYDLPTGGSAYAPVHCQTSSGLLRVDSSSIRHKSNITPVEESFDTSNIFNLQAKAYDREGECRQMGFIAEEFVQHFPMMTYKNKDGQVEGINYSYLTVPIINEMQKMRREMETMREEIVTLRSIIDQ